MKKYSEEKEKIINRWEEPRSWEEKYKNYNYIEYVFNRVNRYNVQTKTIWVYKDLIFNRRKDMINYIESEMNK